MRILVIDDQPEALKQIERAIASAKDPEGRPFEVRAEVDHQTALRLLNQERFDIVVTDMLMGPEEDEGLTIIRQLAEKSPITIVLTAYPAIPNCVAAIKAGAWDYLEKVPENGSDAYDNLLKSIHEACRHRREHRESGKSPADTRWVHQNLDRLMREYPGEIVAVLDQQVVDHGSSFAELAARLREKFPLAEPEMISVPDTRVDSVE
jgi:DNA-binding NtrC family response regulator